MKLEFRDLRSEAELREARRLRAEVYVEEKGWVAPHELVNGLDLDEHDDVSIHGGAFDDDGSLVGTFRVIRDTAGLPISELFGVKLDPATPTPSWSCRCSAACRRLVSPSQSSASRARSMRARTCQPAAGPATWWPR